MPVFYIDNLPTIITSIKREVAAGFIISKNFNIVQCYIARVGGVFAHGETIKQAYNDVRKKYFTSLSLEYRIKTFIKIFKKGKQFPASLFYEWHHILTGSCTLGRNEFCIDHNIKMDDLYTVDQFISLTENSFGSDIIKKLKTFYRKIE